MTDQNKTDGHFDVPKPDTPKESAHHFEADIPKSPRKGNKRGAFGADFGPRQNIQRSKESSSGSSAEPKQAMSTHVATTPVDVVQSTWFQRMPINSAFEKWRLTLLLLVFIPFTLFAYWPAVEGMFWTWWTQIDYGHGFFVIPLVILFLYIRLDNYPGTRSRLTWLGLLPILLCFAMRHYAAGRYMDALDHWSMLFWILGIVWFFYGTRVFLWALPSLSYLAFMFPLPYRYEVLMRNNLQSIASKFGAGILQMLGEPAIAINNTIRLSTEELAVETACSGIRFLISILALAFAAILLLRRPWWQNILVILVAAPLALFVNASRIAMTGILLVHFPGFLQSITPNHQRPSVIADEIAGFTMIIVALIIFLAFLYYLGKVFRRVEL